MRPTCSLTAARWRRGSAPDLPGTVETADLALMIDMAHYLPDDALALLLRRVRERLAPRGLLLVRVTVPSDRRVTALRLVEAAWALTHGLGRYYRGEGSMTALMEGAGFTVEVRRSADAAREEKWFICRARAAGKKGAPRRKKR